MRVASAGLLFWLSLRARWRSHLWIAAGMAAGMLALGTTLVAGVGLGRSLQECLRGMFPENRVLLRPRALDVIWLKVETTSIDERTVAAVRALPGVRRASPEATIRFPVSAEADLLGNAYRTDITVTGVEPWLLGADAPTSFTYRMGRDPEVPAVLAQYFLDLYNMTLAESNQLPKLSPAAAIGRHFRLFLGVSSLRSADAENARSVDCRIVGLSRNPDLLGLVVPLEAVEAFNAWHGLKDREYRGIHVEFDSPHALDALRDRLAGLGLEVLDTQGPWRRAVGVLQLVGYGFAALGGLVFALALAFLAGACNALLAGRRRESRLLAALGATLPQLALLVLAEFAAVTGIGILAGLAAVAALLYRANVWYALWRADRIFLPPRLFDIPPAWIPLLGLACWGLALAVAAHRIRADRRRPIAADLNRAR